MLDILEQVSKRFYLVFWAASALAFTCQRKGLFLNLFIGAGMGMNPCGASQNDPRRVHDGP